MHTDRLYLLRHLTGSDDTRWTAVTPAISEKIDHEVGRGQPERDDLKNELEAFRCALRWNPRTTKV